MSAPIEPIRLGTGRRPGVEATVLTPPSAGRRDALLAYGELLANFVAL